MATSNSQAEPQSTFATFLVEQFAESAKHSFADLSRFAKALRLASRTLEGNVASPYLDRAADRVDKVVDVLHADPNEVLGTLRRFALAQPALFLGGAVLTGVGAARVLMSPAQPDREHTVAPRKTRARKNASNLDEHNGGSHE